MCLSERLEEYVLNNSLKRSSKRNKVLEVAKQIEGNFTMPEIVCSLEGHGVSQTSTYRHITTLIKAGIIIRAFEGITSFKPVYKIIEY